MVMPRGGLPRLLYGSVLGLLLGDRELASGTPRVQTLGLHVEQSFLTLTRAARRTG